MIDRAGKAGFLGLRRSLAAAIGALIGGLGSVSLALLSSIEGVVLFVLPIGGALIGYFMGDRGIRFLARAVDWF